MEVKLLYISLRQSRTDPLPSQVERTFRAETGPSGSRPAPTATESGPSMADTIEFIESSFIKQGDFGMLSDDAHEETRVTSQRITVLQACTISVGNTQIVNWPSSKPGFHRDYRVRLERADPLTLTIHNGNGNYSISVLQPASSDEIVSDLNGISFLGFFYDKTLAARVAKAYIHAIVLCHKPDAPSLF